ncbi:hypothetical protein K440DRAFT_627220 [Wilcoxina mikolae CBS 423.85]|nr:hypothetical protein K440DRAFT_627220 [Wilcoxina mikolae CBS 423.85]
MYSKLVLASFIAVAAAVSELSVRTPAIRNSLQVRSLNGRQSCPSGYVECGSNCAPIGTECCDWGSYCLVGTFCDKPGPGESGEPGCCPDGENCTTGGGTNSKILTIESTNTIEEPAPTAASVPYETPSSTYSTKTPTYSATLPTGTGSYPTPTNGTVPSMTAQPSFTGAAVKDAVPVAAVGIAAVAGLFGFAF